MNFKIGDRVKVKQGLKGETLYGGLMFYDNMYTDEVLTIEMVDCDVRCYGVKENPYYYGDAMLDTVELVDADRFEEIIENRLNKCKDVLCRKNKEYATEDRFHNFKIAAELQGCTPISALAGMMAKHTVSVYDLIRRQAYGEDISADMWEEKIGDSINYLLLLTAMVEEQC